MTKENKTEIISVRVTKEAKQKYELLQKEFNMRCSDLIIFLLENAGSGSQSLDKINMLNDKYDCVEQIQEEVQKLEKYIIIEMEHILKEKEAELLKND